MKIQQITSFQKYKKNMLEFRGEKYITVKEYMETVGRLKYLMVIYNSIFNPVKYISIEANMVEFRFLNKTTSYYRDWEDMFIKI